MNSGPARVLLDANICVALINNRSIPARRRLSYCSAGEAVMSSIVFFELVHGALKSERQGVNVEAVRNFAKRVPVIEFTEEDAMSAAEIRRLLEKQGAPIGSFDTLIAGQARARSLIVATNNLREFGRVPDLEAEDWLST
jgi:tRNA(fMet)-specific endonuclease VapC